MTDPIKRPFQDAFDKAFGIAPTVPTPDVDSGEPGAYGPVGTTPYADGAEHVLPAEVPTRGRSYGDFHPTDARAVEIFLEPNHLNLIPNPACRVNADGWTVNGLGLSLSSDSWVGQALHVTGTGTVFYQDAVGDYVYVGPTDRGFMPRGSIPPSGWFEPQKAGSEYTFSAYAKGTDAYVQLSMYGYQPKDPENGDITPEDTPSAEQHSPFYRLGPDYERYMVKTVSRQGNREFAGCWWIKVEIEIGTDLEFGAATPDVYLSAFMLDNREDVTAEYFDADMTESPTMDDFLWIKRPDQSPEEFTAGFLTETANWRHRPRFAAYYYDRVARVRWMWSNIYAVVPVNRPVHIYFHDRANPWDPKQEPGTSLTALFRRGDFNRGLVHHNTVV